MTTDMWVWVLIAVLTIVVALLYVYDWHQPKSIGWPLWVQLHTDDPGKRGMKNLSQADPVRHWYRTNSGPRPVWVNFNGPGETLRWVTLWDAPIGGTLLGQSRLRIDQAWALGNNFVLDLTLTVTAA